MTKVLGPGDIRQEYLDAMGADLGELFYDLWEEVNAVHMYWAEYVELYGTNQERIDLLNRSASGFFWITQKLIFESVVLHIVRLLDAPGRGKKRRVSLKALIVMVDPSLEKVIKLHLNNMTKSAAFCWDWRNRHLAHRDLYLALEKDGNPLLDGSREDIGKILKGMADLLNVIREHYAMPRLSFDLSSPLNGAHELLRKLQLGLLMKESRNAQMTRGEEPYGGYRLPDV